jgi:type VI protein secretion system component Hcp
MCGGNAAHHKQQEQMRAETRMRDIQEQAERDRQAEQARMQAMQEAAAQRQQEALRQIAESSKQPIKIKTAADAATPLLKTKQKQATSGLASLRINRTPGTNIGTGTSGTNIG